MATSMRSKKGPKYVKSRKPSKPLFREYPVNHDADRKSLVVRACTVLTSGQIILLDKANKNIKLLNERFQCIAVLKLATSAFDICKSNRRASEFYVTEPEQQTIRRITAEKAQLKIKRSHKIFEECRGITCWMSGLAVTVMQENFLGTLGLLDYDFSLKKKVFESDIGGLFRAPWYLESIADGSQVVVSDQGNGSILCLDCKTFQIIFKFCNIGTLCNPRSLTCDTKDNIYVIGGDTVIQYVVKLSSKGKLERVFVEPKYGLNFPYGIAYLPSENALLLQRDREKPNICIFEL